MFIDVRKKLGKEERIKQINDVSKTPLVRRRRSLSERNFLKKFHHTLNNYYF